MKVLFRSLFHINAARKAAVVREDEWQLTKAETVQAETVQSKQPKDHPISKDRKSVV